MTSVPEPQPIQRYDAQMLGGNRYGLFVLHEDHVAAVAALIDDQVKEIAEYVAAVAAALQQERVIRLRDAEEYGYQQGQRDEREAAVKRVEVWLDTCRSDGDIRTDLFAAIRGDSDD